MMARILLSAFVVGMTPALALAQCPAKHEQVVQCGQGESRDAATGQCIKPVHS